MPVFIVSVTGSKRYQGIAVMSSLPGALDSQAVPKVMLSSNERVLSPLFSVKWIISGEDPVQDGLHFSRTSQLFNPLSNNECINLSRNCQELETISRVELLPNNF